MGMQRGCAPLPTARIRAASLQCHSQRRFLLYTKPDCPLCDGLKDKLNALIDRAQFLPSSVFSGASLEVRDISTDSTWQDDLHLAVPVLAVVDASGQEVALPRPQPRASADRLEKHVAQALEATAAGADAL